MNVLFAVDSEPVDEVPSSSLRNVAFSIRNLDLKVPNEDTVLIRNLDLDIKLNQVRNLKLALLGKTPLDLIDLKVLYCRIQ